MRICWGPVLSRLWAGWQEAIMKDSKVGTSQVPARPQHIWQGGCYDLGSERGAHVGRVEAVRDSEARIKTECL